MRFGAAGPDSAAVVLSSATWSTPLDLASGSPRRNYPLDFCTYMVYTLLCGFENLGLTVEGRDMASYVRLVRVDGVAAKVWIVDTPRWRVVRRGRVGWVERVEERLIAWVLS